MKSSAPYDYLIKVILVGDTGVGKTSFLLRFTEQMFDDASHIATIGKNSSLTFIGIDFKTKNLRMGHCWLGEISNDYLNLLQKCAGYHFSVRLYP